MKKTFEQQHPYISAFIGSMALFAFYGVSLFAGAYYGY